MRLKSYEILYQKRSRIYELSLKNPGVLNSTSLELVFKIYKIRTDEELTSSGIKKSRPKEKLDGEAWVPSNVRLIF